MYIITNLALLRALTGALQLSFECLNSTGDFLQSDRLLHVGLEISASQYLSLAEELSNDCTVFVLLEENQISNLATVVLLFSRTNK